MHQGWICTSECNKISHKMQTMRCKDGYPTMSIHHDPWIQMQCKMHGETTDSAQQQEGSHGNTPINRRLRAKEVNAKDPN